MYSFIISLFKKEENIDKLAQDIKLDYGKDAEIIFFGNKKIENGNNYTYYQVPTDINEDKVLNSIIPTIKGDKLFLVRSSYNLKNYTHFKKLEKAHDNGGDIVLFKKKRKQNFLTKIKAFLSKAYSSLMDYKLFDGDLSVILFGEIATSVLKELDRPAPFTKVSKWAGQKIYYVELDEVDKYVPEKNFKREFTFIGICIAIIGLCVGLLFIPIFSKFYFSLLVVFIMLFCFVLSLLFVMRIIVINKIGRTETAKFDLLKGEKNE